MPRWFTDDEVRGLRPELVAVLDYARQRAGVPFIITSGFRTPEQNDAAGGVSNSAHLRGWAVDLRAQDNETRFYIVTALLDVGFKRIVLYASDGHLHADLDPSLPAPILQIKP